MLSSASDEPVHIFGLTATRDESKAELSSKRKRDSVSVLGLCTAPFTIKPYSDSQYAKPATFEPIRIIDRSQLPLSFLDTATAEQFPPNGLFSSRVDVLEQDVVEKERGSDASQVLIARYEANRALYVVERVQARVYSICKLAPWLNEKEVIELWDPANALAYSMRPTVLPDENAWGPWWKHAVLETQLAERPTKRARISMVRRTAEKVQIKPETQHGPDQITTIPLLLDVPTMPESVHELPAQTLAPPEQLDLLVQQYLEAVYTSKTSLAYFVKGPITRIRNAFTSPDEGAPPTHELVTFLRSMLLSPKASEKKYYEKLPAVIKAIPVGMISDEEATTKPSKARKSKKKTKLSREGVYPLEGAFIKKWWRSEMPTESAGQETIEARIRRRIGDLRVRETLAQLILILEIVALESLATYKGPPETELLAHQSQPQEDSQVQSKKRKKKLDDIALQLDLLLDRLSIWHATEEVGILDFESKAAKQQGSAESNGKNSNDRLHGFCVEVIVPFYMSRLPEQALAINKKLGGPAIASSKRKAMRPPLNSKKSGESKEPEMKKSRRSLARIATDNTGKTGRKDTPSLVRSATDTALLRQQSIKRETSEAPLSAIPFKRSPSRARQSMSQLRHLQGREMDLTATSAAAAAKLKHKARVEDDLKEAIATLKKPNRDLAAGGYMAEIEERGLGSANRSRKQANPVRKVVKDVQVTATPRVGRRTKNMVEQTPVHYHQDPFVRPAPTEALPQSDLVIPSSGIRQTSSVIPGTIRRSTTARELAQPGIAETPSKAPTTKLFASGTARRTIFATPVKSSTRLFDADPHPTSNIFETPVKSVRNSPPAYNRAMDPAIAATPVKSAVSCEEIARTAFATPAKQAEEPSIYDALGWNDDDDFA
ncbi:hypothetical protein E8E12_000413 [Didymella heteroderae]|uniref:DNA replication regulator Sld3 C-terminal domain-containing protein n=1 Tax=Didymella heteroderae TaxID=1769908 RepID=A0A9P4WVW5_9PLEO|nr:hypothetical protein E8E12_000413 [Didymella heteroderae]